MEQPNYIQTLARRSGEWEQEPVPWITPDPLIDLSYASFSETDLEAEGEEIGTERTAGLSTGPYPAEKKTELENQEPNASADLKNHSFTDHSTWVIHSREFSEEKKANEHGTKPLQVMPAETNNRIIRPVASVAPFETVERKKADIRDTAGEPIRILQAIDKPEKILPLQAVEKPPILLPEKNMHEQPHREKKKPEAKLVIGQIIVEVVTPEKKPVIAREKIVERKAPADSSGNTSRPAKFYFGLGQI